MLLGWVFFVLFNLQRDGGLQQFMRWLIKISAGECWVQHHWEPSNRAKLGRIPHREAEKESKQAERKITRNRIMGRCPPSNFFFQSKRYLVCSVRKENTKITKRREMHRTKPKSKAIWTTDFAQLNGYRNVAKCIIQIEGAAFYEIKCVTTPPWIYILQLAVKSRIDIVIP